MQSRRRPPLALPLLAVGALALAGCGSEGGGPSADGRLRVEAAFYPLQWVAEQVGGEHVEVGNLTSPGAEPHDLELTPRDVAGLSDADLVVYLGGFQPAVDDAVGGVPNGFDVADAAALDLVVDGDHGAGDDHGEEAPGHREDDGHDHDGEAGAIDPHFWLDPTKLADVATALADELADRDPENAADYRAGAEALGTRLTDLDADLAAGLADCESTDLVTSHEAFGYLAQRYDLDQVGIAGLTPEHEPSAADLAEVTRFVEEHGVRTIYFETLVSPAVAETVATEAGVGTAVLDPLEGLTDDSEGADYLEVMRANLANLRAGQPCT